MLALGNALAKCTKLTYVALNGRDSADVNVTVCSNILMAMPRHVMVSHFAMVRSVRTVSMLLLLSCLLRQLKDTSV